VLLGDRLALVRRGRRLAAVHARELLIVHAPTLPLARDSTFTTAGPFTRSGRTSASTHSALACWRPSPRTLAKATVESIPVYGAVVPARESTMSAKRPSRPLSRGHGVLRTTSLVALRSGPARRRVTRRTRTVLHHQGPPMTGGEGRRRRGGEEWLSDDPADGDRRDVEPSSLVIVYIAKTTPSVAFATRTVHNRSQRLHSKS
jgi:hypothetical protein